MALSRADLAGNFQWQNWQRFFRSSQLARSVTYLRVLLLVLAFILLVATFTSILRQYIGVRTSTLELRNNIEEILQRSKTSQSVVKVKSDYSLIHKKSIFGSMEAGEAPSVAAPAVPKTQLALTLVGTYVSPGDSSQAIIEDAKTKTQDVFLIGDMVFASAKLVAVQADRIEIERDGQRETLLLEDGTGLLGGSSADSEGEVIAVNESELNAALDNLPLLLTQARAVPYFKDGQAAGLRLFAIKTGSMYEKVGLKNGDILKAINGSSLADMSQAMKLFEQLRQEKSISLEIERNRQKTVYQYRIQ